MYHPKSLEAATTTERVDSHSVSPKAIPLSAIHSGPPQVSPASGEVPDKSVSGLRLVLEARQALGIWCRDTGFPRRDPQQSIIRRLAVRGGGDRSRHSPRRSEGREFWLSVRMRSMRASRSLFTCVETQSIRAPAVAAKD